MAIPVAYTLAELAGLSPRNSAVTLGVFDGVHLGHRTIVETLCDLRNNPDVDALYLITFDPHPATVTGSVEKPGVLSTIEERIELLREFPLDGIFVVNFDARIAGMHYQDFIHQYLQKAMNIKHLVLGYDCHFGHKRQGSPERLSIEGPEMGFDVTVVPAVDSGEGIVSSTEIRKQLHSGRLDQANALLGHPYLVSGVVTQGKGMGRDLGFPTANIDINDPAKIWPPDGVYAVRVRWMDRQFDGMMNVGTAPTIKGGKKALEVHIFDFDHSLYGERISVSCEKFLREEQRFRTVHELIDQLTLDTVAAREALKTA